MEKELEFFVTCGNVSIIITLSEYDTIEDLKKKIQAKFNVPVERQIINGRDVPPDITDNTILQVYSNFKSFTCLEVKEKNNMPQKNELNELDSNIDLEIQAIRRFKEKCPPMITLTQRNLQDVVSTISLNFSTEKKAILLYFHNSDAFSKAFLCHIRESEVAEIINRDFFFIGWDIENLPCQEALISALNSHENLSSVSYLISEKKSAALCLFHDGNNLVVFTCMRGNIHFKILLDTLKSTQEQANRQIQNDPHEDMEIKAIKSLKRKLPSNVSIPFCYVTLKDAIEFICTAPLKQRKGLIIYLHNSADPFSKLFVSHLVSGELVDILNRNFLVVGWDIEESSYHESLISALDEHVNLRIMSQLISNKVAIAVCLLPIADNISLTMRFRGKVEYKDLKKGLAAAEEQLLKEIMEEEELQKLKDEKSNKDDMGSENLQRVFADMLGDRDYDRFEYDEHQYLKDKIGFALKGPPQKESGYDENTRKQIDGLYKVIITENRAIAEFKDTIDISIIYNCLEPLPKEKLERAKKYPDYNPQTDVNPIPIFVLRKCRESNHPCRIFIDDLGRVYQNWTEYLTRNKCPKCEMILPLNGRYQVKNDTVLLEKHLSPACHLDIKVLQVIDAVSAAVGVASGAVFVAAVIPAIAVAPPLLIAAGVSGVAAGIWAIGRSIHTLVDRNRHKESMSFANSEARGAYLNIVAGSLGFVGAGANIAVTKLAARGFNIGRGAVYAFNTVGVLNIGASGVSLLNSGYDVIDQWVNENKKPTTLTILQLGSSVLFFGHAVYNFKSATTIIDETQARVLQDYQNSLRSNRHRKTFTKLMKESLRTHGDGASGKAEVISAIRNIKNKDQVFAALTRNNKSMNKNGIKFSADEGQIKLNGISIDMNEFVNLNKKEAQSFLNNISQENPKPLSTANNSGSGNATNISNSFASSLNDILADIKINISKADFQQLLMKTANFLLNFNEDVKTKIINAIHQAIKYMLSTIAKTILAKIDMLIPKQSQFFEFLQIGLSYFIKKVSELEEKYQKYQTTKDKQYYEPIFDWVNPLYAKRTLIFFEYLVKISYCGEYLTKIALEEISKYITTWIAKLIFEQNENEERECRRSRHSAGYRPRKVHCNQCGGRYYQRFM